MKLLALIGIFLSVCSGSGLTIIDATSQEWVGGIQESGYGTDYILTIKTKGSSEQLSIDQLWVGENLFEVKAVKDLARRSTTEFEKRDTVFVHAGLKLVRTDLGGTKQLSGHQVSPPKKYRGEALLGYLYKGKRKYKVIKEFKSLEKIIYP